MHGCLLHLCNGMLATHFAECLSDGMIPASLKYEESVDTSDYRSITIGSMFAKLFAIMIERRLASRAERKPEVKQASATTFMQLMSFVFFRTLMGEQDKVDRKEGVANCIATSYSGPSDQVRTSSPVHAVKQLVKPQ